MAVAGASMYKAYSPRLEPLEIERPLDGASAPTGLKSRSKRLKWVKLLADSTEDEMLPEKGRAQTYCFRGCVSVLVLLLANFMFCILTPYSVERHFPSEATHGLEDPSSDELIMLVLGDWGGFSLWPYWLPVQAKIARGMASVARSAAKKRTMTVTLGDNFYMNGVENENSHRFAATFHNIYIKDYPIFAEKDSWRVLAGNHDYDGNVTAQIAFTNHSEPWYFPSEYYTFTEVLPGKSGAEDISIQVVMTDTMLLCAGFPKCLSSKEVPRSEEHWQWLEQTLAASDADYLLVAGHHPVYSACKHGSTEGISERMRALLIKYRATAYLSGHDHCSQSITECGVHYHGVGSGMMTDHKYSKFWAKRRPVPEGSLAYLFSSGVWPFNFLSGAFGAITFSAQKLVMIHYDNAGKPLYSMSRPPRSVRDPVALHPSCQVADA